LNPDGREYNMAHDPLTVAAPLYHNVKQSQEQCTKKKKLVISILKKNKMDL
jgi:hypothetical protein